MPQFYRKKNPQTGVDDFYEVGTDRHIGPTEFGQGAGFTESSPTQAPSGSPTEFYRKPGEDTLYESGSDRAIGATEFGIGTPHAGRGFKEIPMPGDQTPIRRSGAGFEVIGKDSPMSAWKNSTQFLEAAKEIAELE